MRRKGAEKSRQKQQGVFEVPSRGSNSSARGRDWTRGGLCCKNGTLAAPEPIPSRVVLHLLMMRTPCLPKLQLLQSVEPECLSKSQRVACSTCEVPDLRLSLHCTVYRDRGLVF